MQCPLISASTCLFSPKIIFSTIVLLSLALGVLSAVRPDRSIGLYQWIMARFNWTVAPTDIAKELRNTRVLGLCLAILGLALGTIMYLKFYKLCS